MPIPNSTTKGYAAGKKRTNLSIDGDLARIAQQHFRNTRFRSISGFLEAKIRQEFRAKSAGMKKAGLKLPPDLFTK